MSNGQSRGRGARGNWDGGASFVCARRAKCKRWSATFRVRSEPEDFSCATTRSRWPWRGQELCAGVPSKRGSSKHRSCASFTQGGVSLAKLAFWIRWAVRPVVARCRILALWRSDVSGLRNKKPVIGRSFTTESVRHKEPKPLPDFYPLVRGIRLGEYVWLEVQSEKVRNLSICTPRKTVCNRLAGRARGFYTSAVVPHEQQAHVPHLPFDVFKQQDAAFNVLYLCYKSLNLSFVNRQVVVPCRLVCVCKEVC